MAHFLLAPKPSTPSSFASPSTPSNPTPSSDPPFDSLDSYDSLDSDPSLECERETGLNPRQDHDSNWGVDRDSKSWSLPRSHFHFSEVLASHSGVPPLTSPTPSTLWTPPISTHPTTSTASTTSTVSTSDPTSPLTTTSATSSASSSSPSHLTSHIFSSSTDSSDLNGNHSTPEASLHIKKGSVFVYRLFDIADEVQMSKIETILVNKIGPSKFNVPKFIDRALIMKNAPVSFALGDVSIPLRDRNYRAETFVKIRDFGVLSFIYQIPLERGMSWGDLVRLAAALEDGSEIDSIAEKQCSELVQTLAPAINKTTEWKFFEDYIIYFVEEFEHGLTVKDLLKSTDVTRLLLAEEKAKISEITRKSVLENLFQYGENDLTLIDWNSAFVIEPGGGQDVPDILEFSLTHLLEMRYYDELLDSRLKGLYDDIGKGRTRIFSSRFNTAYQEANYRYIEMTDFIERAENSLKVVGDFYLATLYRAANRRFRIGDWQQNVTRKMNLLVQVSTLLQGEVNMRRNHLLEIIIVLLIAYEVVMAILK